MLAPESPIVYMKFLSRNLSQYSHQAPFSILVSKIGQPTQPTVDWGPQAARERDRNCLSTVPRPRPRLVSALIRSSLAGVSRLVFARQYRTTDRQAVSKPRSGEPADRPGVLAERKRKRRLSRAGRGRTTQPPPPMPEPQISLIFRPPSWLVCFDSASGSACPDSKQLPMYIQYTWWYWWWCIEHLHRMLFRTTTTHTLTCFEVVLSLS